MREIKFRGLHPIVNKIMDVCVIDWMHDEVFFEGGSDVGYSIEDCKLMQYTGFKDINGVDVYENDNIVSKSYPFYGDGIDNQTNPTELNYVGEVGMDVDGVYYDLKVVSDRVAGRATGGNLSELVS